MNFARSGGSTRSFDLEVELRNSIVHTFSSIEKDEYGRLYEFLKAKGIKIGSKQRGGEQTGAGRLEEMLDSDAEDDDAPDAYLHRVKGEGAKAAADDDDDDESDDDDFNPDKVCSGEKISTKQIL